MPQAPTEAPAQTPPQTANAPSGLRVVLSLVGEFLLAPFYRIYQWRLQAMAGRWQVPRHIGIIMDGNRRFARRHLLGHVAEGHRRGADKLEEVLQWCEDLNVEIITVWIFSLENFQRAPDEVESLMSLFESRFTKLVTHPRIHENQIRIRTLGKMEVLPEGVRKAITEAEQATAHYSRRTLNIGVAYGGREEIVDAMAGYLRQMHHEGKDAAQAADALTAESLAPFLYTCDQPDPDLIIRTSGEVRLSGFLLWQSAYSEFYFCDTNWPAFRKIDFLRALRAYSHRQRRFGR